MRLQAGDDFEVSIEDEDTISLRRNTQPANRGLVDLLLACPATFEVPARDTGSARSGMSSYSLTRQAYCDLEAPEDFLLPRSSEVELKHPLADCRAPCQPSWVNERIVIDPAICHGQPVLRGTRMPVAIIVGSLAGGMSFEEVETEYGLSRDDIRAALKFAGELIEQEQHHPLATVPP